MDTTIISEHVFCNENAVAKQIEGFPRTKEEEENNEWAAKKGTLAGSLNDKQGWPTNQEHIRLRHDCYFIALFFGF